MNLGRKLERLARSLPDGLIGAASLARAAASVAHLPASTSRWLILEFDLAEPDPRPDLAFAVVPAEDLGRRALAAVTAPGWEPIRMLARAWSDPASPAWSLITSLWVELDTGRVVAGAQPPRPSVFLGAQLERAANEAVDVSPLRGALEGLLGVGRWQALAPALAEALRRLPAGSVPLQLGAMLGRAGGAEGANACPLRLCAQVGSLEPGAEAAEPVARRAAELAASAVGATVTVQVDVEPDATPWRGLEVADADPAAWARLLEALVAERAADPALVDRIGPLLRPRSRFVSLDDGLPYRRAGASLSHVKLAERDGRLVAKAYVSLVRS